MPETEATILVSQDLHAGNVLSANREPWLLIDPKPLRADREFSLAPIIRSPELGHSRRQVLRRLDRLTGELGLDRERAAVSASPGIEAQDARRDRRVHRGSRVDPDVALTERRSHVLFALVRPE